MGFGSDNETTGSFDDAIARLRARFVASLPDRHSEIDAHFVALSNGGEVAKHLDAIMKILHKIAGVAGSLGLADLGTQCSMLETQIAEFLSENADGEPQGIILDEILSVQLALQKCSSDVI